MSIHPVTRSEETEIYSSPIRIEVVIINWRPANLPVIVKAFRSQTVACRISVCEVASRRGAMSEQVRGLVDEVYSWDQNHGSFNRYFVSLGLEGEWTWFHDDDMVPGPRFIEFMLRWSGLMFAVMGQSGRKIDGGKYHTVTCSGAPQRVSVVCRGYWIRTANLHHLHRFVMQNRHPDWRRNDDILLCRTLAHGTGMPVVLTPLPNAEERMNAQELPDTDALCKQAGHLQSRLVIHGKLLDKLRNGPRRIFVVTAPPPSWRNLGDHAQLLGLLEWIRKHRPDDEVIVLDKNQNGLSDRFAVSPGDLVLCHPGGNMGERGIWSETGRRHFIQSYPHTRIVVLSQTIAFSDTLKGQEEAARTCEIYNRHEDLHIFARDAVSLKCALRMFPKAQSVAQAPDFALYLDSLRTGWGGIVEWSPDAPVLFVLRNDDERHVDRAKLFQVLHRVPQLAASSSTISDIDVTDGLRRWLVCAKVTEFSAASVIVTDRLHGLIFAYLARRPCVVLPSADHKLRATAATFAHVPWISFTESLDHIPLLIEATKAALHQKFESAHFRDALDDLALAVWRE